MLTMQTLVANSTWTVQTFSNNTISTACTTQQTTVQHTAKKNIHLKGWRGIWVATWKIFRINLLSNCVCTHVIIAIPPCQVSNNGLKQKHMAPLCTRGRPPFAKQALQMASCQEAKYGKAEKSPSVDQLPHGTIKGAKECNQLNGTQYCGEIISILVIVRELERRAKKKKNQKKKKQKKMVKQGKCLRRLPGAAACSR